MSNDINMSNPPFTPPPSPDPPLQPEHPLPPEQSPPLPHIPFQTRKGPPWESRNELGILNALIETWKESLFQPNQFFSECRLTGGFGNPLIYAIIFVMIGTIVGTIMSMAIQTPLMALLPDQNLGDYAFNFGISIIAIFLAPIIGIIAIFVGAGIYHLFLFIFGGANEGYEATFRVLCYSSGVQVFNLIPCCGGLISLIWSLVLMVIGLSRMHDTDDWRAILAIVVPFVLCCCIAVGIGSLIAMATGAFVAAEARH